MFNNIYIHHAKPQMLRQVSFVFGPQTIEYTVLNPSLTAQLKISQNVDTWQGISSALKSQTLRVVSTFIGPNEVTIFDW